MDQAAFPEMALEGLEAIVASGMDSLRVRTMSRAETRARLRSIADILTAPSEGSFSRLDSLVQWIEALTLHNFAHRRNPSAELSVGH